MGGGSGGAVGHTSPCPSPRLDPLGEKCCPGQGQCLREGEGGEPEAGAVEVLHPACGDIG